MEKQNQSVTLDSLLETVFARFDSIAEVHVAHLPTASEVSQLLITIHTGEADSLEEYVDIASDAQVVVDAGEDEPLRLPFEVIATADGPGHPQGVEGTTESQ